MKLVDRFFIQWLRSAGLETNIPTKSTAPTKLKFNIFRLKKHKLDACPGVEGKHSKQNKNKKLIVLSFPGR